MSNYEGESYTVYKGSTNTETPGQYYYISSGDSSGAGGWGEPQIQNAQIQNASWGYVGVGLSVPHVLDEPVEVLIERLRERLKLGLVADALLKSLLMAPDDVQLDVPPVLETPVRRRVDRD